jgi:hypothetical protein
VENFDRLLTPHGGNANLLWQWAQSRLIVIDHNLAFDLNFNEVDFFATHVFRDDADSVFGDRVRRDELSKIISAALGCFDSAVARIPSAWLWVDMEHTLPVEVDLRAIRDRLTHRASLERGSP